jgi:hypothetical protein
MLDDDDNLDRWSCDESLFIGAAAYGQEAQMKRAAQKLVGAKARKVNAAAGLPTSSITHSGFSTA